MKNGTVANAWNQTGTCPPAPSPGSRDGATPSLDVIGGEIAEIARAFGGSRRSQTRVSQGPRAHHSLLRMGRYWLVRVLDVFRSSSSRRSFCTIILTRSSNPTVGSQPNLVRALVASPTS